MFFSLDDTCPFNGVMSKARTAKSEPPVKLKIIEGGGELLAFLENSILHRISTSEISRKARKKS